MYEDARCLRDLPILAVQALGRVCGMHNLPHLVMWGSDSELLLVVQNYSASYVIKTCSTQHVRVFVSF